MLPNKGSVVCLLLTLILASNTEHQTIEDISKALNELLVDARSFRRPRDREDTSLIWQKYEFGTGAGNREEVTVTNITLHTYNNITEKNDWQFLRAKNAYFIRAKNSTLSFLEINLDDLSITQRPLSINMTAEERILLFKVFDLRVEETKREDYADDLMAILLVESENGYFLYWYRITGDQILLYPKLSVQRDYQDMEIIREGNQNELLLLNNNVYLEKSFVDVYSFKSDYSNHRIDIWFCRRFYVSKTSDIQVCPFYGNTVLAFRANDNVALYVSRKEGKQCNYEELEVVETNQLANFVCFESGYIEYLAIAAEKARLFHFFEDEFQDTETDLSFDGTTKVSWITALPLNTYRDESLLLVQFENSTVTALGWQGSYFQEIPLPNRIMNDFDLSKVVVIPKFGFMHEDTLVRVDVVLRELPHPAQSEAEIMRRTRVLLEDVFRTQEVILDETEARVKQSYLRNPVTGFWNLSRVDVPNVVIAQNVSYGAIQIGALTLQLEDISTDVMSSSRKLKELEARLDQVLLNLEDMSNHTEIVLSTDIDIDKNFKVKGTLYAKNVTAAYVNNMSTSRAPDDNSNSIVDFIKGRKSFPSIETGNLTAVTLNGVPLEEYIFDTSCRSYEDVDFSKSKRLQINGHLSFFKINDVHWEKLMQNIVWKNESRFIPGDTIVEGQIIVEEGVVQNLNNLRYPEDYVPSSNTLDRFSVYVTGEKYFSNLSVIHFLNVSTINNIDINDFIILKRDEVLDREITFENLRINENLQIDGVITGINVTNRNALLNETNTLETNVIFENLIVEGNIVLQDSIDTKTWSDFEDLLLKTETNATITGKKEFLSGVTLKNTIKCNRINGHAISEFVTLDTEQQFPNLKKISASVTFGDVKLDAVDKLEDRINNEQNISSGCMKKILVFVKPPIVDEIHFETIKQDIPSEAFFGKLNETFRTVHFENLTLLALKADEVAPNVINGIWNYTNLMKHVLTTSTRQNLTGSLVLDNLEVGVLDVELINGLPMSEFNRSLMHARSLYDDVFNGDARLPSLQVTGTLTAFTINGRDILDIYDERSMRPVIFEGDVAIENLTVLDSVNGRNLSEFVRDAVWKTDKNVTFAGEKTFGNVTCEFLDARFVNGHSVDDILDPDKEQVLRGPVVINGSVTVLGNFNTTGKIKDLLLRDFIDRFRPLGNNSYALRGDCRFAENVSIARLDVSGPIQGSLFDSFLQRVVNKSNLNVTISGGKLFRKPITFNDKFTIDGSLDGLNLSKFPEKAVYIDKPFSINSKIVFKEDVYVRGNLLIKKKLEANAIMGVNMKDLQENAIRLDVPTYFGERMTLDNVTFQASVKVVQVNDLKMDELIPLHTDQFIPVENLMCSSVTYKNIVLNGHVNDHVLKNIYEDTFTIHDDQNITGTIKIRGNIYVYNDFNAHSINDFEIKQMVFTDTNETLTGNFTLENPVILKKNLNILGLLNQIDPIKWQKTAIMKTGRMEEIFGKWKIHGNVIFEKNVKGNEYINGVNFAEVLTILAKARSKVYPIVEKTNENLNNTCENLNVFKCSSTNQIYKFDTFDYLKILEFEGKIYDVRSIDLDNLEYLLVNHGNCSVTLLQYTSTSFAAVDEVSDVGLIDRWVFYERDHTMYVLTIAKHTCGRSLNNIWKLENSKITHVLELGNITNLLATYQDTLVTTTHDNSVPMTELNLQSSILKALVSYEKEELASNLYNDSITPATFINETQVRSMTGMSLNECLNCSSLLNFRVGIFKREEYIYYNEEINQNHIYIWKNDTSQTKILQIIKAYRPKSFLILNFDGFVETLLIFIENNEFIQVYEYRGIEGFVYRNSIKMKVSQLYTFKMRKYTYMEKRHYLAAMDGNRLTILEAKMHGEKLDLTTLTSTSSCYMNACPSH